MQNHEELLMAQFTENLRLKGVSPRTINTFRKLIYGHSERNPRNLPWRKTRNPYRILISEIMLQQTQVERVRDKYTTFIRTFPDFSSLAEMPLSDILRIWQGLGYNRRAKAIQMLAGIVMEKYRGRLPNSYSKLLELPGIGKYTAAAILTFTRNQPCVFIETNIRRVFIHLFFQDRDRISDAEILPLIEKTLDRENPRKWYYALMDYGVMLKKTGENPNKRSAHYQKQSPFHGSNRQIRGLLLKAIIRAPGISKKKLMKDLGLNPDKIEMTLSLLTREGFLKQKRGRFSIG